MFSMLTLHYVTLTLHMLTHTLTRINKYYIYDDQSLLIFSGHLFFIF